MACIGKDAIMKYVIARNVIQQFIKMNIVEQDLFSEDVPQVMSFYELIPENDEPVAITFDDVLNTITLYKEGAITFERFSIWIDAVIALDLFRFDDSSDESLNRIAGIIYALDDEKEDREEFDIKRLDEIISRYSYN